MGFIVVHDNFTKWLHAICITGRVCMSGSCGKHRTFSPKLSISGEMGKKFNHHSSELQDPSTPGISDLNHTVISVGIEDFFLTSFYRMSHDRLFYKASFFYGLEKLFWFSWGVKVSFDVHWWKLKLILIHWMPVMTQLWVNLNWLNIRFHPGKN